MRVHALRRIAGDKCLAAFAQGGEGALFGVEAKVGLAFPGVGSVAGEAAVGEDGADVAVEFDGLGEGAGQDDSEAQDGERAMHGDSVLQLGL